MSLLEAPLSGFDALLSTVQMPAGIPVATVAIGKAGATNAGILAALIIASGDPAMAEKIKQHKTKLAKGVEEKSAKVKNQKHPKVRREESRPYKSRQDDYKGHTVRTPRSAGKDRR
jgi:TRAP-type mannitol/chloroaromatic compound transport system permease large subunit